MVTPDFLAGKRQRLAELMNIRLASSYYSADMPEIKSLPESQLDELLAFYGYQGGIVW